MTRDEYLQEIDYFLSRPTELDNEELVDELWDAGTFMLAEIRRLDAKVDRLRAGLGELVGGPCELYGDVYCIAHSEKLHGSPCQHEVARQLLKETEAS